MTVYDKKMNTYPTCAPAIYFVLALLSVGRAEVNARTLIFGDGINAVSEAGSSNARKRYPPDPPRADKGLPRARQIGAASRARRNP